MTAQEMGPFTLHRLRPIVLVLNDSGDLSKRLPCKGMTFPATR
jgi:hypothetical protein